MLLPRYKEISGDRNPVSIEKGLKISTAFGDFNTAQWKDEGLLYGKWKLNYILIVSFTCGRQ